jgi:hypothetical protein
MSRSRAKRSASVGCRRDSCGSLSATWRWNAPSARVASHTVAMPPVPSSRNSRYGPTASPARRRPMPAAGISHKALSAFSPSGPVDVPRARMAKELRDPLVQVGRAPGHVGEPVAVRRGSRSSASSNSAERACS